MDMDNSLLRPAERADLPAIAAVHLQAYSKSHFTSRLPLATLVRYYSLFLTGGSETIVLEEPTVDGGSEIIGFAVFGNDIEAKIACFKRENAPAIVMASALHPLVAARKVMHARWTRLTQPRPMASAPHLLLSIAVTRQGVGAGGRLLDALLDRTKNSGADRIGLYVNVDNVGALNSYASRGFTVRELYGGQYYMERVCG